MSSSSLFEQDDLNVINESQKIRKEILTSLVSKGYNDDDNVRNILAVVKDMDTSVYTRIRLKTMDKANDTLSDMASNSANILLRLREVIVENHDSEVTAPVIPSTQTFNDVPGISKIGEDIDSYNDFMSKMEQ